MNKAAKVVVGFVALEHLGFMILESFLWTSEVGRKTFGTTPAFAEASKVMAANQGVDNGFLAAALVGLRHKDASVSRVITTFGLVCIVVAGIVGGISASPSIVIVQSLPAFVALVLVRMHAKR